MSCDDVQTALTLYLDGDLDVDRGRAVRGHLRGCASCREIAHQESRLRDGLRALPTIEPPVALWRGISRQLAEAEIADAASPPWRRAMVRWKRTLRGFGVAAVGLAFAAGGIGLVGMWRDGRRSPESSWSAPALGAAPLAPVGVPCLSNGPRDLGVDLQAEPTCVTEAYAVAASSLIEAALEQRVKWTDDLKNQFDAEFDRLRREIDVATEGRPRQRAYRALIRYLQRASTRNEVALAGVRGSR